MSNNSMFMYIGNTQYIRYDMVMYMLDQAELTGVCDAREIRDIIESICDDVEIGDDA